MKNSFASQSDFNKYLGNVLTVEDTKLVSIVLPFEFRIAWEPTSKVKTMRCHKLLASSFERIYSNILNHYGAAKINELGIDLFGGCYNFRQKRGSDTQWSTHAWAAAVDHDPARNGLKVKKPKAQFSKKEYIPMIECFYDEGFLSYGLEKNFDWMHFEASLELIKSLSK